jgi:hypothetical protein
MKYDNFRCACTNRLLPVKHSLIVEPQCLETENVRPWSDDVITLLAHLLQQHGRVGYDRGNHQDLQLCKAARTNPISVYKCINLCKRKFLGD